MVHMMVLEENPAHPKPVLVRMACTLKTRNLHVSTHITWLDYHILFNIITNQHTQLTYIINTVFRKVNDIIEYTTK